MCVMLSSMDTCATSSDMAKNKKRLSVQLRKEEEWILDKAHLLAEVQSTTVTRLVLDMLTHRIDREKAAIEELERLKGKAKKK